MERERGVKMDDLFRISGTDLVILLPMEVDHYNTEKVRKQADLLMQKNNIKRIANTCL